MVTLPAKVLHPFMNCFKVLTRTTFWRCLTVILLTRVLHPIMNCSFLPSLVPVSKFSWTGWASVLPSISYHPMTICTYKREFWKKWLKLYYVCLLSIVTQNCYSGLNSSTPKIVLLSLNYRHISVVDQLIIQMHVLRWKPMEKITWC